MARRGRWPRVVWLLLLAAPAHARDSRVEVEIHDFAFVPPRLQVAPGTTVRFINRDAAEHSVSADDRAWSSANLKQDQHYDHVFDGAGTVGYHCQPHPFMKGTIDVGE